MSEKTITTKEYVERLRELFWHICLEHKNERKDEVEEQQKYQQEKYAIEEVNWAIPDIFVDLYYLESLIKHTNKLPKLDEDELGDRKTITFTELANKLRKCYWKALVSKREWDDELGEKDFLKQNHNYDYRINGFRKVFATFGLADYYSDLDILIEQVHYRLELASDWGNKYIQFDPETGEDVINPKLPQPIEI